MRRRRHKIMGKEGKIEKNTDEEKDPIAKAIDEVERIQSEFNKAIEEESRIIDEFCTAHKNTKNEEEDEVFKIFAPQVDKALKETDRLFQELSEANNKVHEEFKKEIEGTETR